MHSNMTIIEKNASEKQRGGEAETGRHSSYSIGYKYTKKTQGDDT